MRYNKANEAIPWAVSQRKSIVYIYGGVLFADTQSWLALKPHRPRRPRSNNARQLRTALQRPQRLAAPWLEGRIAPMPRSLQCRAIALIALRSAAASLNLAVGSMQLGAHAGAMEPLRVGVWPQSSAHVMLPRREKRSPELWGGA